MDVIFNLLKQLATTLSPTEFLIVISLLSVTIVTVVKFFLKNSKKGGIFQALVGAGEDLTTPALLKLGLQLETQAATHTAAHDKILELIVKINERNEEQNEVLRSQITDVLLLKKDLDTSFANINREFDDIKHHAKMHDAHAQQTFDSMKELIQRSQDLMNRAASQLEKVDEFIRASVPEFRSYHKELSKEVGELSRDIALVERTVQSQMNNSNAIKLR